MVRLKVAGEDLVRLGVNEALASSYDDTELRERIGALEEGKVDKVAGKDLSTNDYTDADKVEVAKIDGIEEDIESLYLTKADKTELTKTDRRLDALYELTQGQAWDFETVENTTNPVIVPAGAKMCNLQKISGKTVVWNQLIEHGNFDSATGWSGAGYGTLTVANNIGNFTLSEVGGSSRIERAFTPVVGHKVFVTIDVKTPYDFQDGSYVSTTFQAGSWNTQIARGTPSANTWTTIAGIRNVEQGDTTSDKIRFYVGGLSASVGDIVQFRNAMIIDLTQMFGAGNEPSTVEEFKAMFPNDYYEYKTGELVSVEIESVDSVGKNIVSIDETLHAEYNATGIAETSKITVIANTDSYIGKYYGYKICEVKPNTQYTLSFSKEEAVRLVSLYYKPHGGGGNARIGGNISYANLVRTGIPTQYTFTTNSDVDYLVLLVYLSESAPAGTSSYISNIQLEEGSTATPYSPYRAETIELPIADYFPDGMKSAGSVRDEMTKDKASERAGTITFDGSENWAKVSSANRYYIEHLSIPNKKQGSSVEGTTNRYVYVQPKASSSYLSEGQICFYNNTMPSVLDGVYVWDDSITTLEAFKSSLASNPLTINYELAEPIETTVTDWIDPFTVEAGGTITFVDGEENSIPTNTTEEYTVKLSEVVTNG